MSLDPRIEKEYIEILKEELKPAMGCTEPIAIAFCSAKAAQVLGKTPEKIDVYCSGNIIKNTKAVVVPNSGGMKGIDVAAVLGAVGGNADNELEVLSSVSPEKLELAKKLLDKKICKVYHQKDVENLYIRVVMSAEGHEVSCTVKTRHDFVSEILLDGKTVYSHDDLIGDSKSDKSLLNLKDIYEFVKTVPIEEIRPMLEYQIECNKSIADEGLVNDYGSSIGKTYLEMYGKDNWRVLAAATAAAGSDARMNGCPLPVVINSGSGNQGLTVSMPVYIYAKHIGCDDELFYRGLALSNLVSLLQKRYIGDLSAYCGVCCAGCSSVCGIAFIDGYDYETIGHIIINASSTIGGMVCDGAKSSCASKIASAVMTSLTAYEQAKKDRNFKPGEGLIVDDIEKTIANIGRMGREGMKETDEEILKIMLGD